MKSVEAIRKRLKLMYYELMTISSIYTKNEALELFRENEYPKDSSIIIQKAYSSAGSKESASFDFTNNTDSIEYSSDVINEISICDDEDYFFINVSYDESCKNSSKLMYNEIMKKFTLNEYPNLIKLLITDCNSFDKNFKSKVNHSFKYIENILNSDDVFKRFITDKNFGLEMILIYVYNFEELERAKYMNMAQEIISTPEVSTINDMIRNTLLYMYNSSIKTGVLPNDVIMIFREFLNEKLNIHELEELFKDNTFGNIDFKLISNRNYVKKIMISDYYRFKQMQLEQEVIDDVDMEQLCFIEYQDIDDIIDNFDVNNDDFATNVITDFIIFNNDFDIRTKNNYNKNQKILQKVNPLYQLDFMDFNSKKPKTD